MLMTLSIIVPTLSIVMKLVSVKRQTPFWCKGFVSLKLSLCLNGGNRITDTR